MNRTSSDDCSAARKRALRQLSHEQPAAYAQLYETIRGEDPSRSRHSIRGRAWTRLRYQFPDRYLELYAAERGGFTSEISPDIRSKSWQRATGRLADLLADEYRQRAKVFQQQGMTQPRAYDRAMALIREAHADLFTQLLAAEYQLWTYAETIPEPDNSPAKTI